jgi:hypothetical protein
MTRLGILKYLMLVFAGTIMLIGAALNVTLSPKVQGLSGAVRIPMTSLRNKANEALLNSGHLGSVILG